MLIVNVRLWPFEAAYLVIKLCMTSTLQYDIGILLRCGGPFMVLFIDPLQLIGNLLNLLLEHYQNL